MRKQKCPWCTKMPVPEGPMPELIQDSVLLVGFSMLLSGMPSFLPILTLAFQSLTSGHHL